MERALGWTLDIGGIPLALEGPAFWVEPFARAWERWGGATPVWRVGLEPDAGLPPSSASLFAARPRFADGHVLLRAPGFAGEIVPQKGWACLRAHPGAGLEDIACFVRTVFALCAFEQGAILFHAAGVVHREVAWAFFGNSGSGKTTLVSLSRGKVVLSDDLLLLRRGQDGWMAWTTPFSRYRGDRLFAPLRALLRLMKAPEDRLERMSPGTALGELVANSPVVNADPVRLPALFARWEEIRARVPVCALLFRKTDAFWGVIDAKFG